MKIVSSYNEWDPLEEVIVGIPDFWSIPHKEPGFHPPFRSGLLSDEQVRKATVQFDLLERVLKDQCNVTVRRPEKIDYTQPVKTPFFSIPHQHGASCPRDSVLIVGNEIIESTMSLRSRFFEFMSYRKIFNDYMDEDPDMLWTMAPKPTMDDSMYHLDFPWDKHSEERRRWIENFKFKINESQPVFDAAEVLRLGRDLIVQQSMTTNRKGIEWLRRHVKSRGFRVHDIHVRGDYNPVHIDSTLVPLIPPTNERKGILMCCPERPIIDSDMERIFKGSNWEIVKAPMPDIKEVPERCLSSAWLSMNFLLISPNRALVEENEASLMRFLESHGVKCIPIPHRDCYSFGGGLHCHTLDIRRKGECVDYFPNLSN